MALFDAFLKLEGIKGESADAKHKGEIDVMSFSWGVSQTAIQSTGGGGGAGKVKVHDISISKKTDAASPLLMLNCASGARIKEATLVVRKAGGTQLEYLKIKLTDVLVSSYKPYGCTNELQGNGVVAQDDWSQAPGPVAGAGGSTASDDWSMVSVDRGTNGNDEIPMESVSLNFARLEMAYQAQGADGKPQGGPVLAGWDVKANQKV